MNVYVVQHVHEVGESEDVKFIGVYSTEASARSAVQRLSVQPGFAQHPDGFHIGCYEIDKAHWTEGFIGWDEASKQ